MGLQRQNCSNTHCTKNSKHIFPEMKLRSLVPNFYIHVSVSDLYINRSQIHECGNWETEHYNSVLENNEDTQCHF